MPGLLAFLNHVVQLGRSDGLHWPSAQAKGQAGGCRGILLASVESSKIPVAFAIIRAVATVREVIEAFRKAPSISERRDQSSSS